jgi:CubicO group peptidase (beta-lactamase class C family)
MSETTFNPPAHWRRRIAPTESRARSLEYLKGRATAGLPSEVLRGVVHDPTAWRMHGVAGHAGLFSSARDVAVYSQVILDRGTYGGKRVFSPYGIAAMTSPQTPKGALVVRGFGWDIESPFSTVRGDLFTSGFGHTGFTGTSLWIHPASELVVILLSNRVHPDGKGDVGRLRSLVSNVAAASVIDPR